MIKSKIEMSPAYSLVLQLYGKKEAGAKFTMMEIGDKVRELDPTITDANISAFFKKLKLQLDPQLDLQRKVLRDKRKQIAAEAIDEVLENPKLLPIKERIKIGEKAEDAELKEEEFIYKKSLNEKTTSLMEKFLNRVIYGELVEAEGEVTPADYLLEEGEYEEIIDTQQDTESPIP